MENGDRVVEELSKGWGVAQWLLHALSHIGGTQISRQHTNTTRILPQYYQNGRVIRDLRFCVPSAKKRKLKYTNFLSKIKKLNKFIKA